MTVTHAGRIGSANLLGASGMRMFPSLANRLKALGVLGASVTLERTPQMPRLFKLLMLPVGLILIALSGTVVVLLVYVSVALSMLFTWLPAVLLNTLLR
ncbi:MAG: hypothetical protein HC872_03880 [Gammaproteobacteria bacterium]|nr:hypothetical protein [Gammaproteobacteria bacterium]